MKRLIILLLVIFQFKSLPGQSCLANSLEIRHVKAILTDNSIDFELQNHQVYLNSDCVQNDKLLLHLVGSFDNPANTTYFPSIAANRGYKVIALKYSNDRAVKTSCGNSNDPDCYTDFRNEVIFGGDSSSAVDVSFENSIVNRLEKLLLHLEEEHPSEAWEAFLTEDGEINWPKIVVSGHSQGGGHAAFIAKQFPVDRVIMFASPSDYSEFFSAPADWISSPSATDESNYYVFANLFDNVVDFGNQYENWEGMKLLLETDSINVDNATCHFKNSQVLYTRQNSSSLPSTSHNNMIIDNFTPLSEGSPVFKPVWEYMLGLCDVSSIVLETDLVKETIRVFPNPARSQVFIESEDEVVGIEVYDLGGRLVKSVQGGENDLRFDLDSHKGLFLLKIIVKGSNVPIFKKVMLE